MLAGVAVAALGTAVQQYLLQRNSDVIHEVYSWIRGRVSTATWGDVRLVLPYVRGAQRRAAAAPPPPRRAARGRRGGRRRSAREVRRVRLVVVIAATLGTAAVVSVSGLIGFVGIMVPHLVRLVAGSSYRRGAAAQHPGRRRVPDPRRHPRPHDRARRRDPIGVVTALFGAPFFIFVLRTRRVPA